MSRSSADAMSETGGLVEAASQGSVERVRSLLQSGVDVNSTLGGRTALAAAAGKGHVTCVDALLNAGADVNTAIGFGNGKHIRVTALVLAASLGHNTCVQRLIRAGADVNLTFKYNLSPLLHAADSCQYACVETLLRAGADVNAMNERGHTTLYVLLKRADMCPLSILKLCLKFGANVNLRTLQTRSRANTVHTQDQDVLEDTEPESHVAAEGEYIYVQSKSQLNHISTVHTNSCSGAYVNSCAGSYTNSSGEVDSVFQHYVLKYNIPQESLREVGTLLYTAGESMKGVTTYHPALGALIKRPILRLLDLPSTEDVTLKNICRNALRKHFMRHSQLNLFAKVTELELPSTLKSYLVFEQSVDSVAHDEMEAASTEKEDWFDTDSERDEVDDFCDADADWVDAPEADHEVSDDWLDADVDADWLDEEEDDDWLDQEEVDAEWLDQEPVDAGPNQDMDCSNEVDKRPNTDEGTGNNADAPGCHFVALDYNSLKQKHSTVSN